MLTSGKRVVIVNPIFYLNIYHIQNSNALLLKYLEGSQVIIGKNTFVYRDKKFIEVPLSNTTRTVYIKETNLRKLNLLEWIKFWLQIKM